LNIGPEREARIYYLVHFVAQELGLFRGPALHVEFVDGGEGQVLILERGGADLSIGGPMMTMRLQANEGKRLVCFCSAVRANVWFLVGRTPEARFQWENLIGRTVIDFADAPTPGLCFRWLLRHHGIQPGQVKLMEGLGTRREIDTFLGGGGDYLLHSLHTVGPLVHSGDLTLIQELATPTGPIPWSAYIALPALVEQRRADFAAFTRGIANALRWIHSSSAADVGTMVARFYPSFTLPALIESIERYKKLQIWPTDPRIPRSEFEHYRDILLETGWIQRPVPYEDQVDTRLADQTGA